MQGLQYRQMQGGAGQQGPVASLQVAELRLEREIPGNGYEATVGRKGWAEQDWRGREHLCQFCFLAPHFTRDIDRLVWVQQEEQGAPGQAAGAWNQNAESSLQAGCARALGSGCKTWSPRMAGAVSSSGPRMPGE